LRNGSWTAWGLRLRFRQIAREIAQKCSLAETSFIAVEDNPADAGGVGNVLANAV
jgi:hypothetical protein